MSNLSSFIDDFFKPPIFFLIREYSQQNFLLMNLESVSIAGPSSKWITGKFAFGSQTANTEEANLFHTRV
jgi:hypothetical protein